MSKDKTQKEQNLNEFLQSQKYENLRYNLNLELNHNSQLVNSGVNCASNLIVGRSEEFNKTPEEKIAAKLAKKAYKTYLNTLHGNTTRNVIVTALIDNIEKNWPRYSAAFIVN